MGYVCCDVCYVLHTVWHTTFSEHVLRVFTAYLPLQLELRVTYTVTCSMCCTLCDTQHSVSRGIVRLHRTYLHNSVFETATFYFWLHTSSVWPCVMIRLLHIFLCWLLMKGKSGSRSRVSTIPGAWAQLDNEMSDRLAALHLNPRMCLVTLLTSPRHRRT